MCPGPVCEVKFIVDDEHDGRRTELCHVNGHGDLTLDGALEDLYSQVCEHTAYQPVVDALPFGFVPLPGMTEDDFARAQVKSLKYHAEKKALVTMLLRSAPELKMSVNIKMCADCRSFLTHAAQYLGRPIEVFEPSRKHVFRCGACKFCDVSTAMEGSGGTE